MEMPKPMRQMGAIFMMGLGSVLSSCQTENITPDGGGLYPADPNGVTKDYIIESVKVDARTDDDLRNPTYADNYYTITFKLTDSTNTEDVNLVMESATQETYTTLGDSDNSIADMQANLNGLNVDLSSNGSNWVVTGSGFMMQAERANIFNMDPQFGMQESVVKITISTPKNGVPITFVNTHPLHIADKAIATNTAFKDNFHNLYTTPLAPCNQIHPPDIYTYAIRQPDFRDPQLICLTRLQ